MNWIVENIDFVFKLVLAGLAAYGFFLGIKFELKTLKIDVQHIKENQKSLQEAFSQLGSILTKVAVQDTRLNMIEKKLDELAHNKGFVN